MESINPVSKTTVYQFKKLAAEKGLMKNGPVAVCLSFDSMIMKKSIVQSSRNVDKGRFIGCVISDDLPTLERQFENFVREVARKAREGGDGIFVETL